MATTVFDVLNEKIEDLKKSSANFLANGGAKSLEEYREVCGVIRGLTAAQMEIQDLAKINEEWDD
jgi:hypothetical protein